MYIDVSDVAVRNALGFFVSKYNITVEDEKFQLETDDEYIELSYAKKIFPSMKNVIRGIRSDYCMDIAGCEWLFPSHKEKEYQKKENEMPGIGDVFLDSEIDLAKKVVPYENRDEYSTSFFVTKIHDRQAVVEKINGLRAEIIALRRMKAIAVGDITSDMGLLMKSKSRQADDPPAWHVSFWKISEKCNDGATFKNIRDHFEIIPYVERRCTENEQIK